MSVDVQMGNVAAKVARVMRLDSEAEANALAKMGEGREVVRAGDDAWEVRWYVIKPGNRVTTISLGEGDLGAWFTSITAPNLGGNRGGLWTRHSFKPPAWVTSTNETLSKLLAAFYGCPEGLPADFDNWIK